MQEEFIVNAELLTKPPYFVMFCYCFPGELDELFSCLHDHFNTIKFYPKVAKYQILQVNKIHNSLRVTQILFTFIFVFARDLCSEIWIPYQFLKFSHGCTKKVSKKLHVVVFTVPILFGRF